MFRRIAFFLFFLFLALTICAPVPSMAANPPDYERAKAQLARLHQGKHSVSEWQACADAFLRAYRNNPKWRLRSAALYRNGVALEGRARVSRSAADARKAVAAYEQMVRSYPDCALADDALYRAALVYGDLLRDPAKARVPLDRIARGYAKSDHAAPAASYRAKLDRRVKAAAKPGKSAPKAVAPAPEKKASPAAKKNAPATKKNAPAASAKPVPRKVEAKKPAPKPASKKPASESPAREVRAPAPKGKPIAQNLAAQLGLAVRTVVIDAGHGGRDPGAMHHGVVEKDINLDLAKRLTEILSKRGYAVKLTRDRNKWLSLGERVRYGKKAQGDLFVSIHVNACENPKASGFETYILDFARTSSASRLAVIENANSGRLGDMDKVLTEIVRGARTAESRRLADKIQAATLGQLRKQGYKVQDGGVKGAPFFVLVGSSMPSVLVEVGYCSNKYEASRLKNPKYRQQMAQGIANGIHAYARDIAAR